MEILGRCERQVGREPLEDFVDGVLGEAIHAKRVESLSDGVDGVLHAARFGVRAMRQGLAAAQGLAPRHAITQGDRRLSNANLLMQEIFRCWVRFVVGQRVEIVIHFDWTEFEDSDQSMVVLGMQTGHGRSTPLVWKTVTCAERKGQSNDHEDAWLTIFATVVPDGVRVTVGADRGFSDSTRYGVLREALGFDDIIRVRAVVDVEATSGECRQAGGWVGKGGGMRVLHRAYVTAQRTAVPVVVCVQEAAREDAWCLASRREDRTGGAITLAYGRRFSVEETFRDVQNPRFGLGLKQTRMTRHDRRDARFLLAVLVHTRLTRLGKAGQDLGTERMLGATRPGQLSLVRQGLMLDEWLPRMREDRLRVLMTRFGALLRHHVLFTGMLGVL